MTRVRLAGCIGLLLAFLGWGGGQAHAQSLDSALLLLRRSAQNIADKAATGVGPAELAAKSRQLLGRLDELEDRLEPGTRPPSQGYVLTLQTDAQALAAAALQSDPQAKLAAVMDVDADLGIKLSAARAGLGIAGTAGIDVRVEVSTVRGTERVDGFLVHANSIRYRDAEPMFPFGNPSSPAVRQLAPGRYVVIGRRPDSPEARQTFDIGADGEQTALLKLLVQ